MKFVMLDLSVIILTYNEELHIRRCIENVEKVAKEIFVIDSFSKDNTVAIVKEYSNVKVFQNKWENNYAKQFNWGLCNAPIKTEWVLRLDADEYLLPELLDELLENVPKLPDSINGLIMKRRLVFMDKWLKKGIYPVKLLRIFRNGKALCEQRLMDEHIQLKEGETLEMKNDFVDHNLNNLPWFCQKHVNYAIREAADLLDIELNLTGAALSDKGKNISEQAHQKRTLKHKYAAKPLFLRSFLYFVYRYLYKGACMEGSVGFVFTFIQGWWYRTLVDAKVYEIKQKCGSDPDKIKKHLQTEYSLTFDF